MVRNLSGNPTNQELVMAELHLAFACFEALR
jgi:hypothetical protein